MIYRVRIPRSPDEWVISSGGVFLPGSYATEAAARWAFRFTYEQLRDTLDRVRPRAITTQDLRETRDCLALPRATVTDASGPATPALDALLARVDGGSKWMTHAASHYLARTAAPRLAAIVRVLVGATKVSRAMNEVLGAEMRASRLSQVAALLDTALARAEAIASGRDPATTPNPTTHTIPADAPASDAGTQHKEP